MSGLGLLPAVYARLNGGLGNQLFQYATAYSLAQRLGVPLRFRWDGRDRHVQRRLTLGRFGAEIERVTQAERVRWRLLWPQVLIGRAFGSSLEDWAGAWLPVYCRERSEFEYEERFEHLRAPCFLDGNWQNPKYFENVQEDLIEQFRRPQLLSAAAERIRARIETANTVALHVRLTDYVWGPHRDLFHGVCDVDYYARALEALRQRVPDITVLVFSDDLAGAAELLRDLDGLEFSPGGVTDVEDLVLISLCRHHIISNSTFSWWGAWLAQHDEQVVVAPRSWMSPAGARRFDVSAIYPQHWVRS